MTLMTNGKKVSALALGGTEFYSMTENADGSVIINGHTYDGLIGRGASGLSSSTQYYLEPAPYSWTFEHSTNSVIPSDFGIIAAEVKAGKWHVVAISDGSGGLLTNSGPTNDDYSNDKYVAWFSVNSLKISNVLFRDVIANPPTSFLPPINTYSISVADNSFAVTPLSQITSTLKDSVDGVVLGNDGEQYLHLSNSDCFVKLSDATDEKDTQIGQEVNLTIGMGEYNEAYNLNYSNHKYTFTDQGAGIGINHPEAIMNARFMVNGTQYYHTNVTGYGNNWFKKYKI